MQSWILALALVFAAGGALANDNAQASARNHERGSEAAPGISAPDFVPPIPAPGSPVEAVAPIDGPWPASPAPPGEPSGSDAVIPPIPAPEIVEIAMPAAPAETPKPKVRPAFDPEGTIHVVERGDTLWDISDLYLGTPWIWPSVWKDNEDIENPHLILPGDKIWVSATEMRKVSDEEAAALLAAKQAGDVDDSVPAAMAEDMLPVPTPVVREVFEYSELATVGVVRKKELKGLAQIVGTIEEAVLLAQGDIVFVDLGNQDTRVGDEFVIFRTSQQVYDPSTRHTIGHHTEIVGWLEIIQVHGASARAKIQMSYADFVPGVYLKPREAVNPQIVIQDSPQGVEGQLADLLVESKYNAGGDVVVLNRGSEHGLQVGSPLEIYRPVSGNWKETWYGRPPDIEIPHEVVAEMIVLSVEPTTAMAYVRRSNTELWHGDRFRTVGGPSVEWPEGGLFILPRIRGLVARIPSPNLDIDMPEVDLPDKVGNWNVPRLALPALDGYDPR